MDQGLFTLMLGSVPVIAIVYLVVEGLKRFGFVSDKAWFTAPRAALATALVMIGVALLGVFMPDAQPVIDASAPIVFGGLIAGLFYDLVGDLFLQRVQAAIAAFLGE